MIKNRVSAIETLGGDDVFVVQALALETRVDRARKLHVMLPGRFAEFEVVGHGKIVGAPLAGARVSSSDAPTRSRGAPARARSLRTARGNFPRRNPSRVRGAG